MTNWLHVLKMVLIFSKRSIGAIVDHWFEQSANCFLLSELPSYDMVIPAILEFGLDNLKEKCKLTPGVPLKPMLAKPTKAIGEVLDRCEGKKFTCEYKYDGERAQVSYTFHT